MDTDQGPSTASSLSIDEKPDSCHFIGELDPGDFDCKYVARIHQYNWELTDSPQNDETRGLLNRIQNFLDEYYRTSSASSANQTQASENNNSTPNSQQEMEDNGILTLEALIEFQQIQCSFQDLFNKQSDEIEINPLENHLILKSILDYLPVREVRKCRALSRILSVCGAASIRRRHKPIKLYSASIDRIRKTLLSSPVFPFSNFQIQLGRYLDASMNFFDCHNFFTDLGSNHVRTLKIFEKSPDIRELGMSASHYSSMLRIIFCNMTNLETLTLWRIPSSVTTQEFVLNDAELEACQALNVKTLTLYCPLPGEFELRNTHTPSYENSTFFSELLKWIPNLRTLNLIQDPTRAMPKSNCWPTKFLSFARAINSSQIEELSTDHHLAIRFLERIEKSFLILRIPICIANAISANGTTDFLENQTDSLKTLEITTSLYSAFKVDLPKLNQLQTLELKHERWKGQFRTCTCALSPIPSSTVPRLQTVAIQLLCIPSIFQHEGMKYTGVKELRLLADYAEELMDMSQYTLTLSRIPTLFPSLKKLRVEEMCLNSSVIMGIFANLTNLEDLDMDICSKYLDSDVNYVLSGFIGAEGSTPMDPGPEGSSLMNLKRLTKLRIKYRIILEWNGTVYAPSPQGNPINDFTARMALLKIQRLQLTLAGHVEIPKPELSQLEIHHQNFTVTSFP